jgi:hypothetical protein
LIISKTALLAGSTFCAALSIALISTSSVMASGGAGGGGPGGGGGGVVAGPVPPIAGDYAGTIMLGAPIILEQMQLMLTEDAAGNLSGQVCFIQVSLSPNPICNPLVTGKASPSVNFPFGVFQFRTAEGQYNGIVQGPITCADGTQGAWLSGSLPSRGTIASFGVTTCAEGAHPFG